MILDMFEGEAKIEKEEEIETVEKKLGPFDFLNSITQKIPLEFGDDEEVTYNPFLINRGLSYFQDTILYADMMNTKHHLNNSAQFSFLLNTIRNRKRYSKWYKREANDDIDMLKEHYGFSEKKAKQALTVMTPAEVEILKQQKQKGGIQHEKRRRETKS